MIIQPFKEGDKVYFAYTCLSLIDAGKRGIVNVNALSRFTYPGRRLTEDTIGLNSIGYWDGSVDQDWGLDWHRNEGIELHFLESGNMPYSIDDQKIDLVANDMTISRPWQAHKVGDPIVGKGRMYWLILDVGVRKPHMEWIWPEWMILPKNDLERLTTFLRHNEQARWETNTRIRDCFRALGYLIDSDENGSNAGKLRLRINELFMVLLDLFDNGGVQLNSKLTDSLRSVELFTKELNDVFQDPWTAEGMAEAAGLGLTRFTYIFKQFTNQTPIQYLNYLRLENSKKLLIEKPEYSVAEVAYICGFSSGQYFATLFKKHEKKSPIEFKNAQLV